MNQALNPRILQPGDADPNWRWDRHIPALGHMGVDFEPRVDFRRLQRYRLPRPGRAEGSDCGALLLFDVNNIRYVSGTKIGEWERDKFCRFALLTDDGEPIVWDFGSAAVHHRLYLRLARSGELPRRRARHARHHPADLRADAGTREGDRGAPARGRLRGHAGRASMWPRPRCCSSCRTPA